MDDCINVFLQSQVAERMAPLSHFDHKVNHLLRLLLLQPALLGIDLRLHPSTIHKASECVVVECDDLLIFDVILLFKFFANPTEARLPPWTQLGLFFLISKYCMSHEVVMLFSCKLSIFCCRQSFMGHGV